jgi:hypothetical protein
MPNAETPPKKKRARLPATLEAFVHEYDGNGGNGTRAWFATHPEAKSYKAAATSAWLALKNPEVRAALDALKAARYRRLQMNGDEALARVSLDARSDPRELFDEHGRLMPARLWPANVAQSVRAVKFRDDGTPRELVMNDALHARRIILEQTGKLKNPLSGMNELARILAGKDADDEEE